jgi:hypothetical protein
MQISRPEQRLVHANLSTLLIDYMSRIKCNGHAGTKSERNFCIYCKTKRCYLSVPEGFRREGEFQVVFSFNSINLILQALNSETLKSAFSKNTTG